MTRFCAGLEDCGAEVKVEKLKPAVKIPFPFPSTYILLKYMVTSFFRCRVPLQEPAQLYDRDWDLIVLAGPTWSYNPSGPILSFIDSYGTELFQGRSVLPFISCRAYWRTHLYCLKSRLRRCGAHVYRPVVFRHPTREPWKTVGLVMQLLGKLPGDKESWFRKKYPHYGHGQEQYSRAEEEGRKICRELSKV